MLVLPYPLLFRFTRRATPLVIGLLGCATCPTKVCANPPEKSATTDLISPTDWLKSQPKPLFRPDHSLPRLTRYGHSSMPFDVRVELAEHWGYALEMGSYLNDDAIAQLDDRNSMLSKITALAKSDPKRYPLSVICSRKVPGVEAPPETWTHDKDGKVLDGQAHSMDGTVWSEEHGAIFSPEAPDSVWKMAGEYRAAPLRELKKRGIPISMVLNGGEYGLSVLGFAKPAWSLDPKVVAAVEKWPNASWQEYASAKKGNSEQIIADAVRAAVPERNLYIYYTAGGGTLRNKDTTIDDWGPAWKDVRKVSDLPSNELYYKHFNDGFTGRLNMLTLMLNAAALEIQSGVPLSYNWISGGWSRGEVEGSIAPLNRWSGFIKCCYTAGMIGSNVGYYGSVPTGGFEAPFPANEPPCWLTQMAASSHVHALFSQLEPMIRQSDLQPGLHKNGLSTADPAYEIASGDATVRVLARKHKTKPEWLITAWAADGADRELTIEIPELGKLKLHARDCASVYRAILKEQNVTLKLLDEEGATFSRPQNSQSITSPVIN